jgi:hypothetical protein
MKEKRPISSEKNENRKIRQKNITQDTQIGEDCSRGFGKEREQEREKSRYGMV